MGRITIRTSTATFLLGVLLQFPIFAQSQPPREKIDVSKLGPQVGERVPDFSDESVLAVATRSFRILPRRTRPCSLPI